MRCFEASASTSPEVKQVAGVRCLKSTSAGFHSSIGGYAERSRAVQLQEMNRWLEGMPGWDGTVRWLCSEHDMSVHNVSVHMCLNQES